jgi:hypothetical protein
MKRRCSVHKCKRRPARLGFCATHLLRRADELFSQKVRSVGYCEHCKSTERLQCAHIVSRRYRGVRWFLGNALCLCSRCHLYFEHRPLEWQEYVKVEWWNQLRRVALDFDGDWRDLAVECIRSLDRSPLDTE